MFMQLLVAQLQNQDPTSPVDPTTFTSQLVQFNMLDQLTQINNTMTNAFGPPSTAASSSTSGTNPVQGAQ
jgi:flagellar basal-body rod modification protein FlgD